MQPIKRQSLGQEATQLLRKMLLNGHFNAGERLVEDRIAQELGISRTPLREALHRLAQEGILEKRTSGGYVLRALQRTEIEDAITIRTMLESHAASLAASRITDEQKKTLRKNLGSFRKAQESNDLTALVELNEEFHNILREGAHSPLLTQLLLELDCVVERMLRPIISSHEVKWSDADHLCILEYIENGDAINASKAMQAHVLNAKDTLFSQHEDET